MQTNGRLDDLTVRYTDGVAVASFEVTADPEQIEALRDKYLDIDLKEHREKRSLDANAYYWKLLSLLGETLGMSRTEMHNREMARYGQIDEKDGALVWEVLPTTFNWLQSESKHYRFAEMYATGTVMDKQGKEHRFKRPVYWVIRGSHTYDTKEMSILIDGVIQDAKEQGIETLSPDKIDEMMRAYDEAWERKVSQQENAG